MITALILTEGRLEPLAATLAALVAGVAEGLVTKAVVLSPGGDPEVAAVADGVGAAHVHVGAGPGAWAVGAGVVRHDWLFCLDAGDVPLDGWIPGIEAFLAWGVRPRLGRARRDGLLVRLGGLPERLFGTGAIRAGDLLHRSLVAEEGLCRHVRPMRLDVRIRSRR
jgi:hypothetical protein